MADADTCNLGDMGNKKRDRGNTHKLSSIQPFRMVGLAYTLLRWHVPRNVWKIVQKGILVAVDNSSKESID